MGLKITDKRTPSARTDSNGYDIPVGQVFAGKIGGHRGVFLRAYDRIVMLTDPECTFSEMSLVVANYRPVNAELVITD